MCVRFDNVSTAPLEGFHFTFNLTDPDNPGVNLIKGLQGATLLQWRVWSEDSLGNAANMGPVKIDATAVDDFDVKILNDSGGAGALNVAGINLDLDPSADGNFSNLSGANITGMLSGTFLQRSNTGEGGNVTGAMTIDTIDGFMVISSDVLDPMTVTTVSSGGAVLIVGNLGTPSKSANIDITTTLAGSLTIFRTATNYGDITVGTVSSAGTALERV